MVITNCQEVLLLCIRIDKVGVKKIDERLKYMPGKQKLWVQTLELHCPMSTTGRSQNDPLYYWVLAGLHGSGLSSEPSGLHCWANYLWERSVGLLCNAWQTFPQIVIISSIWLRITMNHWKIKCLIKRTEVYIAKIFTYNLF